MHPAPSVIFFSTFSGLGFGLLVFLGLGMPATTGVNAFIFFTIAYLLAVGGLISSTFHLGHPERALKAFTQWRTSWLSREAWCAVLALLVMALYGAGLVFFAQRWTLLGIVGAMLSLGTVYTTSMIYTQMKTGPRWHSALTPANFVSLCIGAGPRRCHSAGDVATRRQGAGVKRHGHGHSHRPWPHRHRPRV